jgi:glycosyltransferase involved in cell wall biosynthesis
MENKTEKVILLCGSLNIAGTERNVLNIARLLNRSRFEPIIYCFDSSGSLFETARAEGLSVVHSRYNASSDTMRLAGRIRELASFCRGQNARILHCFNFPVIYYGLLASFLARTPVFIVAIQDHDIWKSARECKRDRLLVANTDLFIADSEGARLFAVEKEGFPKEKMTVVYDGVIPDELVCRKARSALLGEAGLVDGLPVVGVVARLDEKKKGQNIFLEAVHRIREEWSGERKAQFAIIGDGMDRMALEQKAMDMGLGDWIVFISARKNVAEALALVDILVISSRWESAPKILIEGMATGKQIVSARAGDVEEFLRNEENGLLSPIDDSVEMARNIGRLIADPELGRRLGDRAMQDIQTRNLNMSETVARLEEIYADLLRKCGDKKKIIHRWNAIAEEILITFLLEPLKAKIGARENKRCEFGAL